MNIKQQQIIAGCKKGDAAAQRQLYEMFNSRLFCVCLRYACDRPEAQDMLQEAFLSIFRDIHQYKGDGPLEAWLCRVTARSALRALRKSNPLRLAQDYDNIAPATLQFTPDAEFSGEAILLAIRQLPEGYRTVFNLHCMEDFSYPEIAAELGITESTVRSQYARACKQLRTLVEGFLVHHP